jgi:pimeloyl-ACP methyl ester carboxylesterase
MKPFAFLSFLLALALPARAADIAGLWQDSITPTRFLEITHKKSGGYRGQMFFPGDTLGEANGNTIPAVTVRKGEIQFSYDKRKGTFRGAVSADGKSLTGTWQVNGPAARAIFTRIPLGTVIDPSPHTTHMIAVDKGVQLEVLDWGGSGTPLVFLTGLGNTAHVFDTFAPRFTAHHHVYAITRRGYGISSIPDPNPANYDADRLGDDVVAVLDALKLDHPVLAGHSISGEELSSVGTRHPGRISGLIYLEAGYGYAFYTPGGQIAFGTNLVGESRDMENRLEQLKAVARDPKALPSAIAQVQADLSELQTDLKAMQATLDMGGGILAPPPEDTLKGRVMSAILDGTRKYTRINVPVLAFYAIPPNEPPGLPEAAKTAYQHVGDFAAAQADAFAAANPQAHVLRLPHADHYIFRSNRDAVEREMNAFMDGLSPR